MQPRSGWRGLAGRDRGDSFGARILRSGERDVVCSVDGSTAAFPHESLRGGGPALSRRGLAAIPEATDRCRAILSPTRGSGWSRSPRSAVRSAGSPLPRCAPRGAEASRAGAVERASTPSPARSRRWDRRRGSSGAWSRCCTSSMPLQAPLEPNRDPGWSYWGTSVSCSNGPPNSCRSAGRSWTTRRSLRRRSLNVWRMRPTRSEPPSAARPDRRRTTFYRGAPAAERRSARFR